ncbi:hypothetical protein EEB18_005970 [Sphingopyxis sp. OPL5]|uniref:hypothetical protein n=1 Tax=unclassified Sphingopyxis TaxID=2614943 RepID=UPI0006FC7AC3|nr:MULTISPECIES: hypothetical protein [unclassified Sphingopyxis]KQZ65399.1 hypothetical protein ASD67_03070 [Sphingopyxis sp. Root1497]OHD00825.1 MAG: hypothetical protein A2885_12980 [Sphingopyxis sp. RIFCSPHIGHO2_01_FULL_65_24]QNO28496.1 hypothetical protein EEB18_005970 [Sphingopyxis sp. OPL5]
MSCPEIRTRRLGLTAAAALVAIAVTGTAAAQSMVVRSTGPSASKYPAGTKLKNSDRVTLVAGDKVVLIQGGKTKTLTGAGTFTAGATVVASQSMGTTVTRMMAKRPMATRGGASRGPEEMSAENRAPNLWLLDYRAGGTFCVADPATLMLWRPDMTSDTALTIASGDKSETVAIVSGAQFRKWPTDSLPVQYDVDYRLSGGGLAAPVTVRFAALAAMPETPDAAGEMLLGKGCTPQLDRLVDAMAESEATGG